MQNHYCSYPSLWDRSGVGFASTGTSPHPSSSQDVNAQIRRFNLLGDFTTLSSQYPLRRQRSSQRNHLLCLRQGSSLGLHGPQEDDQIGLQERGQPHARSPHGRTFLPVQPPASPPQVQEHLRVHLRRKQLIMILTYYLSIIDSIARLIRSFRP